VDGPYFYSFFKSRSSRISIALTIARIFAPGDPIRTFAITVSFLFLFFFVSLSTLYTIICYSKMHLTDDETSAFCYWNWTTRISISAGIYVFFADKFYQKGLIFYLVAALLTDALAFATPLYCLLQVRLPKKQRRLVVAGFIGSALMALTSIAFTILLYGPLTWNPARLTLMSKSSNFQVRFIVDQRPCPWCRFYIFQDWDITCRLQLGCDPFHTVQRSAES